MWIPKGFSWGNPKERMEDVLTWITFRFSTILDSISVLAVNRIAHKRWRLCPTRISIQRPLPKRMAAFLQPININDVLLFLSSKTLCCPLHFSSVNLPESSSCVLKHISPKNVLVCQSERGDEITRALERLGLVLRRPEAWIDRAKQWSHPKIIAPLVAVPFPPLPRCCPLSNFRQKETGVRRFPPLSTLLFMSVKLQV